MNIDTTRTILGNHSIERTLRYLNMRTDHQILHEIVDVKMGLEPESLEWDGERTKKQAEPERKRLQKRLKDLYAELGREPDEDEIERFVLQREQAISNR